MSPPTFAESVFFAELTRALMRMKDAPFAEVEAAVEERFRAFLRQHKTADVRSLAITFTWTLPDGADGWAEYGTEYRTGADATRPASPIEHPEQPRSMSPRSADVIPFPKRAVGR